MVYLIAATGSGGSGGVRIGSFGLMYVRWQSTAVSVTNDATRRKAEAPQGFKHTVLGRIAVTIA
jgi:hypothetical protein